MNLITKNNLVGGNGLTGKILVGSNNIPATWVWILSSTDPQPIGVRGLWTSDDVWGTNELWYQ